MQGGYLSMILYIVVFFGFFYFMLIRPQQKRQKEHAQMLSQLKKGDKVVTFGGLYGTVVDLTEDRVTLKANENTRLVFERSAIKTVLHAEEKGEEKKETKE